MPRTTVVTLETRARPFLKPEYPHSGTNRGIVLPSHMSEIALCFDGPIKGHKVDSWIDQLIALQTRATSYLKLEPDAIRCGLLVDVLCSSRMSLVPSLMKSQRIVDAETRLRAKFMNC